MQRKPIEIDIYNYPEEYRALLKNSCVYDSSCSREAKVIFVDRDGGYYLKNAPRSSLSTEAEMGEYFNKKSLSSRVLSYLSLDSDWLLTERVKGEDCTFGKYLSDPKKLCDTTASLLRELHATDFSGCPVRDRLSSYEKTAEENHKLGKGCLSLFSGNFGFSSIDEAWKVWQEGKDKLKNNTLIHGDYCLPNIMLDDWKFSGFIDLGNGGVGDRHIDIFWGVWTLFFNLGTEEYTSRFLDAYGRENVDTDLLRVVAAAEVFG